MPNSALPRANSERGNEGPTLNCLVEGDVHTSSMACFANLWLAQAASSLAIESHALERLATLAGRQGIAIDMARFALDLGYAYRRLALAHGCVDGELRGLAVALFDACQRLELRRHRLVGQNWLQ